MQKLAAQWVRRQADMPAPRTCTWQRNKGIEKQND